MEERELIFSMINILSLPAYLLKLKTYYKNMNGDTQTNNISGFGNIS